MSSQGRYRQRLSRFAENWRAMALRGLVAVLFGLVILFWPGLILAVLSLFFGIYALVDGGVVLVPALRSSDRGARRWLPLAEGTAGVIAGLVALLWPGLSASGLLYTIVGWAVATGTLVDSDLPSLTPFIGVFAVVVGLALIVFALRIRDRQRNRQA